MTEQRAESSIDPYFKVALVAQTPNPQQVIWRALHQDYSENFAMDEDCPEESEAGRIAVKRLLSGDKGHFGCLEHPQITMNVGWFSHVVMQQARTHRIACSFDVQSFRYTSQRILDVVSGERKIEEVFYFRPVGFYVDRQGKKYEYTEEQRYDDKTFCLLAAGKYLKKVEVYGHSEEHARGIIPFDTRQHFVVSFSLRSLLHFLDLRSKADAQLEIRQLCLLMWPHFKAWAPEIAAWYEKTRLGKARLAP
jgi:thymidylate synthase (FAD)